MKAQRKLSVPLDKLRTRAEKRLAKTPREIAQMPGDDIQKLVHELQVHQIELEMQNEQLREAQLHLEDARDRFAELYDFAPVAYLSLSPQGRILEANLRAVELLGLERGRLIHHQFTQFVRMEARDTFYVFFRQVFSSGTRQTAELDLVTAQAKRLVVHVEAVCAVASALKHARFSLTDLTGRKQAEEALHEASQLNQQIITGAKEGIIVYGRDLKYLVWNPFMEELSGVPAHEVIGKRPAEVFPFLQAAGVTEQLSRVLAGAECAAKEFCFQVPQSGRAGWVSDSNSPLRNAQGEITGVIGMVRDITGQKLAEAALRESEAKYRKLFEISVDAIILAEPLSGRFIAGNPAALKMFGAKNEAEFVLHGPVDLSPERQPDGRISVEKAREMMATALREGSHFFEWTHRRITGEEFFADVLLSRMEQDGKTVVLASVRDITKRKRAENALRTSERNLRILTRALEQSPASVLITNTAGEIEYVNPKFSEVTGYSLAEVLGQNPRLLKSGHQSPEFYKEMWTTITSGRDWRGELCSRKKDGALFWESAVIAPIHDEHGTITHFVALKEDITISRRLEAELVEVADREQQRIGHDLHDGLGQRLTALEMKCFLLQEDLAAAQDAASRRRLQQQAQYISKAVRECITVTRAIAHGLAPVVLKTEGLRGALAQLAQRTRVPGKLECRLVCPSPVALEDFQTAKQLYRIAQEAVNNALKHARTRQIRIQLTHAKGMLCLQISDSGRGLPAHKPLQSGIGLEVMRHRAHAIGATLEINSKPGKGVSVICTLPIKKYEN